MRYVLARVGLLLAALGGAAVTGLALVRPVVGIELPAQLVGLPATSPLASLSVSAEAVERAIGRPAFRADRRAPVGRYDPEREPAPETPAEPPAPKPALAISGIVWGDVPAAVVEGLPGAERSVVLRVGDAAAGLRVVRIQGDRVLIRGMDTTWHLTVREAWK
jgi:hypothetical protein